MKRLYFLTVFLSICLYVNTFFATKVKEKNVVYVYLFEKQEKFDEKIHVKKIRVLKCCGRKICDKCYKDNKGKF